MQLAGALRDAMLGGAAAVAITDTITTVTLAVAPNGLVALDGETQKALLRMRTRLHMEEMQERHRMMYSAVGATHLAMRWAHLVRLGDVRAFL